MRVLVCGSRDYGDSAAVWATLDLVHATRGPISVIIHGGARGADLLADKWAIMKGVPRMAFKPDWAAYGRAAGPIRNGEMLAKAKPDLVVAFPGKKGTADMVRQAMEANVEVVRK